MVQVERNEVCDFLNGKADTVTLFVQKHVGCGNVENVSFMAYGTKAYCFINMNPLRTVPTQFRTFADALYKLGIVLHFEDLSENADTLKYEVLFFEARSVTVWRVYPVTKAEAALRCLPPSLLPEFNSEIDDEWLSDKNIELQSICIADEEHQEDHEHGCEYERYLHTDIIEF